MRPKVKNTTRKHPPPLPRATFGGKEPQNFGLNVQPPSNVGPSALELELCKAQLEKLQQLQNDNQGTVEECFSAMGFEVLDTSFNSPSQGMLLGEQPHLLTTPTLGGLAITPVGTPQPVTESPVMPIKGILKRKDAPTAKNKVDPTKKKKSKSLIVNKTRIVPRTGGIKRPQKYRPGTVALREI